jgi:hypothetical protein
MLRGGLYKQAYSFCLGKCILRTGVTLLLAVIFLRSSILFQKVNAKATITDKEYRLTFVNAEDLTLDMVAGEGVLPVIE